MLLRKWCTDLRSRQELYLPPVCAGRRQKKDAEMRSSFLLLLFHLHKYLYILKPNMNI